MLNWILNKLQSISGEREALFRIASEVAYWHNHWEHSNITSFGEDLNVRVEIKKRKDFYTATDRLYAKVPRDYLVDRVEALIERGRVYYLAHIKKI